MPEIKYHPKALVEAFQTARFYDGRCPGLGAAFFDELDKVVRAVADDPLRKPADVEGLRSWRLRRFPIRVWYAADPGRIRVVAVADLRRRPGYWRKRIRE